MKSDVLTLAAVVFVIGMLVSGLSSVANFFEPEEVIIPPSELQLGSTKEAYIKSK